MTSFFGTFNPLHESPVLVAGATGFKAATSANTGTEVWAEVLGLSTPPPVFWSTVAPESLEAAKDLLHTKKNKKQL